MGNDVSKILHQVPAFFLLKNSPTKKARKATIPATIFSKISGKKYLVTRNAAKDAKAAMPNQEIFELDIMWEP